MLEQDSNTNNGRITPASHIGDVVIGVEVHVAERITNLEAEISSRKEEITRLKATINVTTNRQQHRGIGNNIDGRSISPSFFNTTTTAKSDNNNNNEENSDKDKEDEIA